MTSKQLDQALKSIEDYIVARVESAMVNATVRETGIDSGPTVKAAQAAKRREARLHERMVKTLGATLGVKV